jgi:hypothetical protein
MKTKDTLEVMKYTAANVLVMALVLPIPLILLIAGIALAYRL